jgi:RNA polymerase-binding transcription factor
LTHGVTDVQERLSRDDLNHFERKLRERLSVLRSDVLEKLSHAESYAELAGQVHDAEDESLADLLADVGLADVTAEQEQARDIDAALDRLLTHIFGSCTDCGEPIGRDRLEAYPTAKRCLSCQRSQEKRRGEPPPPTL